MVGTDQPTGEGVEMSLLCSLGLHRPEGVPRWNDGYYFTKCGRCGRDLVRTAYGRWDVPRGYRIVWQAQPPVGRPDIKLEPAGSELEPAQSTAQAEAAVPDEPVSTASAGEDAKPKGRKAKRSAAEVPGEAQAGESQAATPRTPSNYPDFMDDDFGRSPPKRRIPRPAPTEDPYAGEGTAAALATLPRLLDSLRRPRVEQVEEDEPEQLPLSRGSMYFIFGGAALAALIVAAVIVALYRGPIQRTADRDPIGAGDTPFAVEEPAQDMGSVAFVTASLLSCRSAPSLQAPRLRSLARGTRVGMIAADGDWVSLASDGRQCWVLARYLSSAEPY
jgi:hypothetical protein